MKISVIIPTYNEAQGISKTLNELQHRQSEQSLIHEIIVVDGKSDDGTQDIVSKFDGIKCISSPKSRPIQMNTGASQARGDILYFLHADCLPPQNFDIYISNGIDQNHLAGCFRMKFDDEHPWIKFISWLTKFKYRACRGGDQSLFVTKSLFEKIGGFDKRYLIFEDHEILGKIYNTTKFCVIQEPLVSSARRFRDKGILKLQLLFWAIYFKKWLGATPEELFSFYKKHID
ncbi:TIGR04283 family arsenosugar biosynthesis glycosyltransferase [Mesohalobacter halotolerans]|uniref:TIGR04283 family arsenosugar biosynthesis glycosyltransferase n=1 Tax=Mesohalobacter halotolerans TaxID=1883405 RepID=UPI001486F820|nr:TIGR04283 family arsenosugar biosynthesis glycosyltransferase [Mesohalobacter halotolerans]MBS3739510.1 TIGR04283 family arsenosugar biosynthesis glycosyltransferase [Psychroflexus sp.]